MTRTLLAAGVTGLLVGMAVSGLAGIDITGAVAPEGLEDRAHTPNRTLASSGVSNATQANATIPNNETYKDHVAWNVVHAGSPMGPAHGIVDGTNCLALSAKNVTQAKGYAVVNWTPPEVSTSNNAVIRVETADIEHRVERRMHQARAENSVRIPIDRWNLTTEAPMDLFISIVPSETNTVEYGHEASIRVTLEHEGEIAARTGSCT